MPKASKSGFYAVHKGRQPGIYMSWADCENHTKGYPSAVYKKFSTEAAAKAFVEFGFSEGNVVTAVTPSVEKTTYMSKKLRNESIMLPEFVDESGWDVVYTDGACQGNGTEGAVAGIGVWWGHSDPRNMAERCPGDQTNNRAELIAIIRALETTPLGTTPLLIKTDSSYSISCIRDWMPSWRHRGWKTAAGSDVKNKGVIVYLANLLDQRSQKGQRVELQHVRGHAGHVGNEGADVLAGLGASMPEQPERDWSLMNEDPTNAKREVVEFYIDEEDILSPEEMERELASDFD